MIEYPYMVANNKIAPILEQIRNAAKPEKITQNLLKTWGFASSNDRAIISVLKRLEFLTEDGVPNLNYDTLRDKTKWKKILATQIKVLYKDLFTINENIHMQSDEVIKGAISRVTGKESKTVERYYSTFKTLCDLADFSVKITPEKEVKEEVKSSIPIDTQNNRQKTEFHYDIQIHLPATTDISVYNAIFKSLKDNLMI